MRLARNVETRPAWAGNVSCGMCGLTAEPAFAIKHKAKAPPLPPPAFPPRPPPPVYTHYGDPGEVKEDGSFEPFMHKCDLFAKTGSGQTQETLKKCHRFLRAAASVRKGKATPSIFFPQYIQQLEIEMRTF